MHEMIKKSQENFKAGRILVGHNLYAPSIRCFCYSCVQAMIYVLVFVFGKTEEDIEKESRSSRKAFHNWLINKMYSEYRKVNRDKSLKFQRKVYKLKKIRVESDYKSVKMDYKKSKKSESMAKDILGFLKGDFGV